MYNEERQPTKRELNYQQLLGLKKEWPKWVFATQQGKDTDYAVCSINNNFVKVCYKYENYRYKGFFISSTPECIEEFTDMFFETADDAFDAVMVWASKNGYKFKEYYHPAVIDF